MGKYHERRSSAVNKQAENVNKSQRRKLTVRIFCAAATLIALIISIITFGWFSGGEPISGGMDGLADASGIYELAAVGANGKYDSLLNAGDGKQLHDIMTEEGTLIDPVATYSGNEIKWMMNDESNMENNAGNPSSGIEPGSSGKLTFYVIAKQDAELDIDFSLSTVLYDRYARDVTETNDNSDCIITDEKVIGLVKGHILFFESFDEASGIYSGRIDNSFNFHKNVTADTAYKVDIYWIWPNIADQLILPSGDNMLQNRGYERIISNTDSTFETDIAANAANYFSSSIDNISDMLENMKQGSSDAGFNMEYYNIINAEWNKADQDIGTNVAYIQITLADDQT